MLMPALCHITACSWCCSPRPPLSYSPVIPTYIDVHVNYWYSKWSDPPILRSRSVYTHASEDSLPTSDDYDATVPPRAIKNRCIRIDLCLLESICGDGDSDEAKGIRRVPSAVPIVWARVVANSSKSLRPSGQRIYPKATSLARTERRKPTRKIAPETGTNSRKNGGENAERKSEDDESAGDSSLLSRERKNEFLPGARYWLDSVIRDEYARAKEEE